MDALWSVASVSIVFALLGVLVLVSKYQAKGLGRFHTKRRISIEDQVRLGAQCSLAVIRIDEALYHMAVTPSGVQVLHQGRAELPR